MLNQNEYSLGCLKYVHHIQNVEQLILAAMLHYVDIVHEKLCNFIELEQLDNHYHFILSHQLCHQNVFNYTDKPTIIICIYLKIVTMPHLLHGGHAFLNNRNIFLSVTILI